MPKASTKPRGRRAPRAVSPSAPTDDRANDVLAEILVAVLRAEIEDHDGSPEELAALLREHAPAALLIGTYPRFAREVHKAIDQAMAIVADIRPAPRPARRRSKATA